VKPVLIGCSGWNYQHWRERVYPRGCPASRWLEHYAGLFDTVEVNTTFYRLPRRDSVARWVEQTPDEFLFAVKMSRYITHIRRLTDLEGGLARFYERIEPLAESPKLGPLLWQLPPTFKRNDERLAAALAVLPPGRHCFEFREPSWYADEVYALLREHGAALVIPDSPKYPFRTLQLTADWTFVRFHHSSRGRRGNYSDAELDEWAQRIDAWRREAEVYAYFNNDWEGFAVANALRLRELLATRASTSATAPRAG
jgi:uncharacterized protein YecE (DUF72 family)